MNRSQKIAWYQLCMIVVAAVASVILMAYYVRKYEYGYLQAWWVAMSYAVLLVMLTVLGPFMFRKKKGQIDFDERDLIIDRKASWIAFSSTYAFFILACMITWIVTGMDSLIPAYWLPRLVLGAWITTIVIHAVTILVCYGRGDKDGQ